jgi:hypothetical protein
MIELTAQLSPLIEKDPIVSTFDSKAAANQPEEVIARYRQHAATYIGLDPVRDLDRRFIEKLVDSQTPKACLVAHYGYGKTTAAIGLWEACCEANILAVPPIGYTSLAEIATTTYSWVRRALDKNDEGCARLDEIYRTYLQASTEELAKIVSQRSGHSFEQVLDVLTDPALGGALRLNPPATNIVLFFEALTQVVCASGYAGAAVFVDEFQQLLGNAGAEIITGLRSLIWGLRTRKIRFGLAITMDPNSERVLSDRAGDIVHRIKDDDLYLDFRQIYGPDFPRLLWERYAEELKLNGLIFRIVDKPTLESLGQICERADLSNGPRTVANAFRRIAAYYASTGKTYTCLQLIDDFLSGAIIFDGDASTIASLVTEFSSYAYFKRSESHLAVLKLLAAFPRGCPAEVADYYGVLKTFNEITAELRGDIVTLLPTGYALIDLQRVGKPVDKLSLILKKYWLQITDAEIDPEENTRRFTELVVPLLFPANPDQSEAWTAESAPYISAQNAYIQVYRGYLHEQHPLRRIQVMTCHDESGLKLSHANLEFDLNLVFVLHSGAQSNQDSCDRQGNSLIFHLNLGRSPERGLPPELRVVEHNLSPQPGTPAVLLNVLEFVEREVALTTLTSSERVRVDRVLGQIRLWLLSFLFNEQVLASVDPEAATPGYRGVRDLLFRECQRRFPNYYTLITSSAWKGNLDLYRKVLSTRTLAERKGIELVEGSKASLAALFGQRNHAGFDSKMRVQYPALLEVTWAGESGTLRFTSHPMETEILTFLGDQGHSRLEITTLGRSQGYTDEEVEELLALLMLRGQVKEDQGYILKEDTVTLVEIQRLAEEFKEEFQVFKEVLPLQEMAKEVQIAESLADLTTNDESTRELAHSQLVFLTSRAGPLRASTRSNFAKLLEQQRQQVGALLQRFETSVPVFSAPVAFKNHLEGARKQLEENLVSTRRTTVRLRDDIQTDRSRLVGVQEAEIASYLNAIMPTIRQREKALQDLQERAEVLLRRIALLKLWAAWTEQLVRLRSSITNYSAWVVGEDTNAAQLLSMLNEIESHVREHLAAEGISFLDQIADIQSRLDSVAREYDRSLAEREEAFEREKAELEGALSTITGHQVRLRGKYQASKHNDSYTDLYAEASQIARNVAGQLMVQARVLESPLQTLKKKEQTDALSSELKLLRNILRNLAQISEDLLAMQLDSRDSHQALREVVLGKLAALKQELGDIENRNPTHPELWLAGRQIVSRLTTDPQDIKLLVNVETTLNSLPAESDLSVLLRLCLTGEVDIEISLGTKRRQD